MCLCLYLLSNKELPEIRFEPDDPVFSVERVTDLGLLNNIKKIRNSTYTYLAGSFEGCSCGFYYLEPQVLKESNPEDYEILFSDPYDFERQNKANQSMGILFEYLRNNASESNSIAMYYCWQGDETLDQYAPIALKPDENLLVGSFEFPERQLMLIEPVSPPSNVLVAI